MKLKLIYFLLLIFFIPLVLKAGYIGTKVIQIDQNGSDWTNNTGIFPTPNNNVAIATDGQFIWQDAKDDDTGDGNYLYPTNLVYNPLWKDSADIDQFRVCWDTTNVYIYIRAWGANTNYWRDAEIIGISTNINTGTSCLLQGHCTNGDLGPGAELRSTKIKWDFTVSVAESWKVRIWDNLTGNKIGDANVSMNNLRIQDIKWNEKEISIPVSLIGNPSNRAWCFLFGWGFRADDVEFFDGMREVQPDNGGNPIEWFPCQGDNQWWTNNGVDPDVMDLIGASQALQESDLSSYDVNGTPGDTNDFVDIQYSYVTVGDWNKFHIQPSSIAADNGDTIPLTIKGYNTVATGAFLNKQYTIQVNGNIGYFSNDNFYAQNGEVTDVEGSLVFSMTGVTSHTLAVTVSGSGAVEVDVSTGYLSPDAEALTFNFTVAKEETIEISIYSLSGQLVKKITKVISPSDSTVKWNRDGDGGKVGSGLYLIKIKSQNKVTTKKVLIMN
ncbi:MAG: T9SS type A sorting domain-containing protein [Spirochaetes bacterium]|nr:T9SS type A sorting domain-containing protein [Spirochaetota bacterium]